MQTRTKIASTVGGAIVAAPLSYLVQRMIAAWGVLDNVADAMGGYLKLHVTPDAAGWTVATILTLALYAGLVWLVWHEKNDPKNDEPAHTPSPNESPVAVLIDTSQGGSVHGNRIKVTYEGDGSLFEIKGGGIVSGNSLDGHHTKVGITPPTLPQSPKIGDITTRISDPNAFRLRAETGSTIDFSGATIMGEIPSIEAHASGGSTVSFEGANIGPQHHHHHGKQPFELTESIMDSIVARIGSTPEVTLVAVGSNKSRSAVVQIKSFLVEKGKSVTMNMIGVLSPPLADNLEWRDGSLYVNADI